MKILIGLHDTSKDESTQNFAKYLGDILEAEITVTKSESAAAFLEAASGDDYDLLVIPWAGTPRSEKFARHVVNGANTSVLVVKEQPTTLQRVLICSGGRDLSNPVIRLGGKLAQAAGAKATLLHVVTPVPSMYTGLEAMEEDIGDLLGSDTPESKHLKNGAEELEDRQVEASIELRHGVAVDEIMRSTELRDYELVVIGASDAAPRLNRLVVGDLTQKILGRAPISVLVVRNPA